jgi:hypothetical protein
MAIKVEQKLEALKSELQQVVETYNQAQQVLENSKTKIIALRGGIAACEDIIGTKTN